jgi:hypothetical protein
MPFPDLDQESRSGILVYLIRGSLVKVTSFSENILILRIASDSDRIESIETDKRLKNRNIN